LFTVTPAPCPEFKTPLFCFFTRRFFTFTSLLRQFCQFLPLLFFCGLRCPSPPLRSLCLAFGYCFPLISLSDLSYPYDRISFLFLNLILRGFLGSLFPLIMVHPRRFLFILSTNPSVSIFPFGLLSPSFGLRPLPSAMFVSPLETYHLAVLDTPPSHSFSVCVIPFSFIDFVRVHFIASFLCFSSFTHFFFFFYFFTIFLRFFLLCSYFSSLYIYFS